MNQEPTTLAQLNRLLADLLHIEPQPLSTGESEIYATVKLRRYSTQ